MIYYSLDKLITIINERLRFKYSLQKDLVKLQPIEENVTEGYISVSIVNIERDTTSGISFGNQIVSNGKVGSRRPSWYINVYVLCAVVFPTKKYADSIKLFDDLLKILQSNSSLSLQEFGAKIGIEPINLNVSELSNLWSISKGTYHPSIYLKLRTIEVDGNNMTKVESIIKDVKIDFN